MSVSYSVSGSGDQKARCDCGWSTAWGHPATVRAEVADHIVVAHG